MKTFNSPLAFAQHLALRAAQMQIVATTALDQACAVIERNAKAEIGHYQDGIGGFVPWAPLAESTLEGWGGFPGKIALGYAPPDNPLLREGDLRDSISREVHGLEGAVGSTSQIMVYQELGTSKMPPRAVIGPAALRSEREVMQLLGQAVFDGIVYGAARAWTPLAGYHP